MIVERDYDKPAIYAQNVSKRFGSIEAARSISLTVQRGEIFGLVGPDGAGKTTIMRLLAGVLLPDAGEIRLEGIDVVSEPERAKSELSYMPQHFGLYDDLTVDENVLFYSKLFGISRELRRTRSEELFYAAGLFPFRKRLAGKLSGGMKQKLGLVCALIHTPRILLLDEPTTGVDPVSRRDFWAILYGLRETGVTIFLSTAYMDEAERCTRLAMLHSGQIRYCDTPSRLKDAMPGALLAIIAQDNPRVVHDALAGAPGVLGLLLMGDRVHARVDDAHRRETELRARLDERAIAYGSIDRVEPGIEDVFVALLGSQSQT